MREFIPPATRFVDLPARFPMRSGQTLYGARMAYETSGRLNTARDNAVLILPGLSPDAHFASRPENPATGWWERMVGPGKPVDTDLWHVICVNPLGSCKGSTGPASINPGTGRPYRLDFPELSIEDIADATAYVVGALGLERLACAIGTSMGGMTALSLLARHPGLARSQVNVSGAVHSLPLSLAMRSLQREMIRRDPGWRKGQYDGDEYPDHGMRMARKLGVLTYRSSREWDVRFGRKRAVPSSEAPDVLSDPHFAVEAYLDRHADRFSRSFDPNSYLYLSRSMDRFDLGESCGSTTDEALAGLRTEKALVMGVDTDILFPLAQQRQIAEGLSGGGTEVVFEALGSPLGHDAFLADIDRFGPPVAKFLAALR